MNVYNKDTYCNPPPMDDCHDLINIQIPRWVPKWVESDHLKICDLSYGWLAWPQNDHIYMLYLPEYGYDVFQINHNY